MPAISHNGYLSGTGIKQRPVIPRGCKLHTTVVFSHNLLMQQKDLLSRVLLLAPFAFSLFGPAVVWSLACVNSMYGYEEPEPQVLSAVLGHLTLITCAASFLLYSIRDYPIPVLPWDRRFKVKSIRIILAFLFASGVYVICMELWNLLAHGHPYGTPTLAMSMTFALLSLPMFHRWVHTYGCEELPASSGTLIPRALVTSIFTLMIGGLFWIDSASLGTFG